MEEMRSLLFLYCLLSSSCFSPKIRTPKIGVPSSPDSAAGPFEHIAYWGSGLAGIAVLVGVILLWSKPKLGQQVIVMALSVLMASQIMLWISAHLALLGILTAVGGLAYVSYRHRERIIDIFDGETTQIHQTPLERNKPTDSGSSS